MDKDRILSLSELLLLESQNTKKACTIGLIIDCSGAYQVENGIYVCKIKIIDDSLNLDTTSLTFNYCFCTVMFFDENPDHLPNPNCIGDVLYLRRWNFQKWNQQFQAKVLVKNISSWALLSGEDKIGTNEYQKSKADMNLDDEKYSNIRSPLKQLRRFARNYFEDHSILKNLKPGVKTKDQDLIVKVVKRQENGKIHLNDGSRNLLLSGCSSLMQEGDIGKLRSIAHLTNLEPNLFNVEKNHFTSLIKIPDWSFDAQNLLQISKNQDMNDDIYTSLQQLLTMRIDDGVNKIYNVKCQIFSISSSSFQGAVKYYDSKKNIVHETNKKETKAVYKLVFLCQDESLSDKKFAEICLFSYDGKCMDFIPEINLNDDFQLSSMVQEEELYKRRYDQLLQADSVSMTVQFLTDGKGNRCFRVIKI